MPELDKYRYKDNISLRNKFIRQLWNIIWVFFFRITPSWGFNFWRILLLRLFGAKVGTRCKISSSVSVWAPWNLKVGDYVCLAEEVNCYSVSPIYIGNKVTISQRAFLCTGSHSIDSLDRPLISKSIEIKEFSWICSEAFIGMGTTIGEGAVVGARSVVLKDVSDWHVVAGNPAKFIKQRVLK